MAKSKIWNQLHMSGTVAIFLLLMGCGNGFAEVQQGWNYGETMCKGSALLSLKEHLRKGGDYCDYEAKLCRGGDGAWRAQCHIEFEKPTEGCVNQNNSFGQAGDVPVVGDWTGNGITKVGIFRPSKALFALDFTGDYKWNEGDSAFYFGNPGDQPVVGHWKNRWPSVGVFRDGWFYIDLNNNGQWDSCTGSAGGDACYLYGTSGDVPVIGDWNEDGIDDPGVYRPSERKYYLDYNGDRKFSGCRQSGGSDYCLTLRDNATTLLSPVLFPGRWYLLGLTPQLSWRTPLPITWGIFTLFGGVAPWAADGGIGGEVSDPIVRIDTNSNKPFFGSPHYDLYKAFNKKKLCPVAGNWADEFTKKGGYSVRTRGGLFDSATGKWYLDLNNSRTFDLQPAQSCEFRAMN